jgi:hypothetical protein
MKSQQPQTQVDVEFTGFGGDFDSPNECRPTASNSCR